MTEARLNAANDLNTGLRELRELAEKATPGLLALTEVAAKAAEYRRLEEAEPAKVDDPARMEWEPQVDEAAVALDDSLARLSVCFSGAHSPEGAA